MATESSLLIVREVCQAYYQFRLSITGNQFLSLEPPKPGTKTWENCLSMAAWCEHNDVGYDLYFKMMNEGFSKAWLKSAFKATYLPFIMAVSQKMREKVLLGYQKARKEGWDGVLARVRGMLDQYDSEMKERILGYSMGWVPAEIRQILLEELKNESKGA